MILKQPRTLKVRSKYGEMSVDVPKDRNGTFEPQVVKNRQTDKILTEIEDWQTRPLDNVYPIVFIDAVHFSVRDNGIVRKLAAYVMLGINCDGEKDIISLSIGENESAKYWLGILNELKNRGVQDIMVICADGLTGIKEAISTAFPKTEYQRCIVHMVRNTLKHVSYKDMKAFATDLKSIYLAPTEEKAQTNLDAVSEKWVSAPQKLGNCVR